MTAKILGKGGVVRVKSKANHWRSNTERISGMLASAECQAPHEHAERSQSVRAGTLARKALTGFWVTVVQSTWAWSLYHMNLIGVVAMAAVVADRQG